MLVGPSTCDTLATLESRSGRRVLASVGDPYEPEEARRLMPVVSEVCSSAWMESIRACGVWTATGYCTPVFGSIQKFGAVCELDESETSRSLPTSRMVSLSSSAALRY